jgi:hypothetical protein
MSLEDHFEKRFADVKILAETKAKELSGCFFFMYEGPDGSYRERVGETRERLISDMCDAAQQQFVPDAEIRYMCRHLGNAHKEDSKKAKIFKNITQESMNKWMTIYSMARYC